MLFVQVKDDGRWTEIPECPHAIAASELRKAREEWAAELAADPGVFGAALAPQTTAREILGRVAPGLHGFDVMAVGFAVTNPSCRIAEAADGPWERLP